MKRSLPGETSPFRCRPQNRTAKIHEITREGVVKALVGIKVGSRMVWKLLEPPTGLLVRSSVAVGCKSKTLVHPILDRNVLPSSLLVLPSSFFRPVGPVFFWGCTRECVLGVLDDVFHSVARLEVLD